jgi:hypothetical protein
MSVAGRFGVRLLPTGYPWVTCRWSRNRTGQDSFHNCLRRRQFRSAFPQPGSCTGNQRSAIDRARTERPHLRQSIDKFQAIELQQHGLLQLSPGAVLLNWPTASLQSGATASAASGSCQGRKHAQSLSQICRRRSYVRHGVSRTTVVYQSSWFVAHTVKFCAAEEHAAVTTASRRAKRRPGWGADMPRPRGMVIPL